MAINIFVCNENHEFRGPIGLIDCHVVVAQFSMSVSSDPLMTRHG